MTFSSSERIVVTGIGVVSPIGCNIDTVRQSIESSPAPVHDGHPDFSGHIDDFGPLSKETKRLIRKSLKLMNRETQLGVAAAGHAINDSDLPSAGYQSDRIGVVFGAGNVEIRQADFANSVEACRETIGEFDLASWGDLGIPNVDPLWILRVLPNMPACHFAIANDFRGPNNTITQAGVATNMAINEGRNAILDGDADAMVVGGTGTTFCEHAAPSDNSAEAAGAFVLERLESALSRGATVYGEILACSSVTLIDADHRARPELAMQYAAIDAIERSQRKIGSIKRICGDLESLDDVSAPLVSMKDLIGNAGAGSNAMEITASLLALQHGNDGDVAVNVNGLANGLASCVVLGSVAQENTGQQNTGQGRAA